MDLETARERLLTERERLTRLREQELHTFDQTQPGTSVESADHQQDPAEAANQTFEAEREQSVVESLDGELALIDHALVRIDDGTYGKCEICGRDIGDERLAARPMARFCIEHQEQVENQARADGFEGADPTI